MSQAPMPTDEDLQIVKVSLIYPIVLDVIERDIKIIKETNLKFPEIYAMKLKSVQNKITHDAYEIRIQMKKRGIKIYEQSRNDKTIEAKYLCRNYHNTCSMLWMTVKTEVQLMLCKYLEIDITDDKLR
jgi:hypothetical protein